MADLDPLGASRSWWIIVASTDLVVAVILLASREWFWGLLCLAIGIVPTYIVVVGD